MVRFKSSPIFIDYTNSTFPYSLLSPGCWSSELPPSRYLHSLLFFLYNIPSVLAGTLDRSTGFPNKILHWCLLHVIFDGVDFHQWFNVVHACPYRTRIWRSTTPAPSFNHHQVRRFCSTLACRRADTR